MTADRPGSPAEEFSRAFSRAFAGQEGSLLGPLLAEDVQGLTLSGQWAEGRAAMLAAWDAEFAGLFSQARLVTGRLTHKMLGPGALVLHQRFIVTGALAAADQPLPRFPAVLSAVLIARPEGWQAVTLSLAALGE